MIDPRQRAMQILNGFDTGTLVRMLETEGVSIDMGDAANGSSAIAQLDQGEPLESFNDVRVSFGKGGGKIFDRRAIERQKTPINAPNQQAPDFLQNQDQEYLGGGDAGGLD